MRMNRGRQRFFRANASADLKRNLDLFGIEFSQ